MARVAVRLKEPAAAGDTKEILFDDAVATGLSQVIRLILGNDVELSAGAATLANSLPINQVTNTAVLATAKSVTTSAALLASQLANRKKIIIQNRGTLSVYVGPSGVANSDGLEIMPGGSLTLDIGPAIALHAVSEDGSSQNVRILELS